MNDKPKKHWEEAKILIVEDQKLHVLLLEKILKTAGFKNIYGTTDPYETMEAYAKFKPDIILLDLKMPGLDGFEVMERLKKSKTKDDEFLPILALSAERGQDVRLRALESGATDFLNKPYESVEVVMRIRNMIETRLLHKQVRDQNKILEEKVLERTKELRETRLDIIHRLARAAEYRDNDTGIHIIRMSQYCAKLAEAVGMSPTQCDLVLNASPLHDIGKIGIPDSILLKPGKLTPDEWEIMKTHTTIGAELLSGSNSPLMKMAQIITLTHHEKWDGSGYPRGLKGEDIPLVGRICSICDVFDALTSNRPYKKAWTPKEAMTEIQQQSGKHFDPQLLKPFSAILSAIETIRDQYEEK